MFIMELVKNLHLNAIGNVASIFTAIIAIVIAVIQNDIHRKSYEPCCDIRCTDCGNNIKIEIKNNGLGYMKIEHIGVFDNQHDIPQKLYDVIPYNIKLTYYSVDFENRSIAPGEHMKLIEAVGMTDDERTAFRHCLSSFRIKVDYSDTYKKKHHSEKNLKTIYGEKYREIEEVSDKMGIELTDSASKHIVGG